MIPRKLSPLDKSGLIHHFKNDIIGDDRRLRFGMPASDDIVESYINDSLKVIGYGGAFHTREETEHFKSVFPAEPKVKKRGYLAQEVAVELTLIALLTTQCKSTVAKLLIGNVP